MTLQSVKIFISGYPQGYDELALVQLVSPFGEVSTVKIVRDKQSGKVKGYAFIEMVGLRDAEQVVIGLDGAEVGDKKLTVNIVDDKPVKRSALQEKKKRPRLSR